MKKMVGVAVAMSGVLLMGVGQAWSLSSETTMLLDLLKAKGVITQKDATEFTKTLELKSTEAAEATVDDHHHSVKSLADRVEKLEGKGGDGLAEVASKVNLSGLLEVDMTAARAKDAAGEKTNTSDVTLKTAQLNADATINQYVTGRIALLYEEAADNNVTLDEAVVGLKGGEVLPNAYANLGRMYVPFGQFKSHFISDPTTKILGETNDTAVVAGYANDIMDLNVGGFKGKVKETGKGEQINSAVASAKLSLPNADKEGLAMSGGISYLSNLATSDGLESLNDRVADRVDGVSAFLSMSYAERFFFDAEYLAALDDFATTDFTFADANNRKPQAWNLEAAARLNKETEFALRYGGSNDTMKNDNAFILADHEYGAALLYDLFEHTNLTLEYLYQKFQDDSNNNQATMQLAVEF
jgi:hypothetical protein